MPSVIHHHKCNIKFWNIRLTRKKTVEEDRNRLNDLFAFLFYFKLREGEMETGCVYSYTRYFISLRFFGEHYLIPIKFNRNFKTFSIVRWEQYFDSDSFFAICFLFCLLLSNRIWNNAKLVYCLQKNIVVSVRKTRV